MDENTRRVNGLVPEDVFFWLEDVAKRNGWTFSRALRWAVQETMKREPKGTGGPSKIQDFRALL